MTKLSKKLIGLLITLGASLVFLALQILLWEYSIHYQDFTRSFCTAIGLNVNTEWLRACSILCYLITLPLAGAGYYFAFLLPRKRPTVLDRRANRRNMAVICGILALLFILAIDPIADALGFTHAVHGPLLALLAVLGLLIVLWSGVTVHLPALRSISKSQLRRGAGRYGLCIVISFLCAVCYGLVLNCAAFWFPEAADSLVDATMIDTHLITGILVFTLFAPLVEELAFRGLMLRGMRRYMSPWVAVTVSSAFFAVWHRNLGQLFPTFAMGLLFAWTYLKTGRLRYAMLVHSLSNLILCWSLSLGSGYLPRIRSLYSLQQALLALPPLAAAGLLLLGVSAIALLVKCCLTSAEAD